MFLPLNLLFYYRGSIIRHATRDIPVINSGRTILNFNYDFRIFQYGQSVNMAFLVLGHTEKGNIVDIRMNIGKRQLPFPLSVTLLYIGIDLTKHILTL